MRVLVVEDDDDVRDAIVDTISRAGHEVVTASHGAEALAVLLDEHTRPSVVLLDLMMPVMDGWSLIGELAAARIRIPIVVLTAAPSPRMPPGIPVLPKPLRSDALLAVLATAGLQHGRKLDMTLYVSDDLPSERTVETLIEILQSYEPDGVSLTVRDISTEDPAVLAADHVATTPTLIVRRPLRLRFAGELRSQHWLRTVLGILEVQRRR